MSKKIAFLSGKGGSGKTTLAITIANLLCKCNIKTLLVDCDLSTNGATYFYESTLQERKQFDNSKAISFQNILDENNNITEPYPITINETLDFLPSIEYTSNLSQIENSLPEHDISQTKVANFINWSEERYDVILFDCQAGYTKLLSILLPFMDVDLFVLEADSISAAAMRNLHLKIGNSLGKAKLYQVFNKATQEEFDIYSKIVGTFFTNIGTLLFDWKIRQAFSRSIVPDLDNTSAKYAVDLCNICQIILPAQPYKDKFEHFIVNLQYRQLLEKQKEIKYNLSELTHKSTYKILPMIFLVLCVTIALSLAFTIMAENISIFNKIFFITITTIAMISSIMILPLSNNNERKLYEKELISINKEIVSLKKKYKLHDENDI